jgi:hypothetical protein
VSLTGIFWAGAGAVVVLLVLVELMAQWGGHSFFTTVVLGNDNRTSTSKTFILLWTLLVGWALICLLIAGELVAKHACTAGPVAVAVKACTAKHDDVGLLQLGWAHFLHVGLVGSYLVLLGIPATAGVAAKGITQGKASKNKLAKTTYKAPENAGRVGPRLAQIFSADDGTTDIADFQYVIFNLITAVFFVANFVKPTANGLPTIPDTLLGLTSVSAALYVGKKAVTESEPKITDVVPGTLVPGQLFTVDGVGLVDPTNPGRAPEIRVNGWPAVVQIDPNVPGRLIVTAPAIPAPSGTPPGQTYPGSVDATTAYGVITSGFKVRCL